MYCLVLVDTRNNETRVRFNHHVGPFHNVKEAFKWWEKNKNKIQYKHLELYEYGFGTFHSIE